MVLTMSQSNKPPPLEPEVEGVFVEEEEVEEEVHSAETMIIEGKGHTDNKEEYLKIMKPIFDGITNNINLLLQREIPMAWGTITDSLTPEINHFLYARETKI